MRGLVDEASQTPFNVKSLAINGNDLIQMGYQPGPQIGQILNALLDRVMENPELNNRETLLSMIS